MVISVRATVDGLVSEGQFSLVALSTLRGIHERAVQNGRPLSLQRLLQAIEATPTAFAIQGLPHPRLTAQQVVLSPPVVFVTGEGFAPAASILVRIGSLPVGFREFSVKTDAGGRFGERLDVRPSAVLPAEALVTARDDRRPKFGFIWSNTIKIVNGISSPG